MKSRTLPLVMLLVFLSLLFAASFRTDVQLLESYIFQIDSNLLYIIISSIACGGFLMFLLLSILPSKKNGRSAPATRPLSSSLFTSLQAAVEMNDLEKVANLIAQIRENDPDYWFAKKVAGDLAFKEGKVFEAETNYQLALRSATGANLALLFFRLGEIFEETNPEQAAAHYREAVHVAPSATEAVLRLRFLAIRDRDWEEALRWQEHVERYFPGRMKKEEEEAIRTGIRYELAEDQFRAGAYKTSTALLKFILKTNEDFTPAVLLSGNIQEITENHSAAMKVWEEGFHRGGHPVLLQRIGESLLSRGLPSEAIQYFRTMVRLYPEDPFVSFCLGDLYRKLEMLDDAMRVFARLEKTQPEWNSNRLALAEIYQKTGNTRASGMVLLEVLSKGEAIDPSPWQCYNCNTTYYEYRSVCVECLSWDSINFNQQKAVKTGAEYDRPTALPL